MRTSLRTPRHQFADSEVWVHLRIDQCGEPIAEDDDLHGASVVIDKRLESADATYGILVSDVVRQMVTRNDFVWGGVAQGVRQDGAGLGARVGLRGRFPGR